MNKVKINGHEAEGLAVWWAVVTGACNKCQHLCVCESDDTFRPPEDAACMVRKKQIIEDNNKRRKPEGKENEKDKN